MRNSFIPSCASWEDAGDTNIFFFLILEHIIDLHVCTYMYNVYKYIYNMHIHGTCMWYAPLNQQSRLSLCHDAGGPQPTAGSHWWMDAWDDPPLAVVASLGDILWFFFSLYLNPLCCGSPIRGHMDQRDE